MGGRDRTSPPERQQESIVHGEPRERCAGEGKPTGRPWRMVRSVSPGGLRIRRR
jgi:hypothetical protein